MVKANNSGSRFIVDLGDVKFPAVVEKQVEAEIQAVVLRAIAENNVEDRSASARRVRPTIWDQFEGHTLGLWPGYPNDPPIAFGAEAWDGLKVQDHTIIMKAIMEHPLHLIKNLLKQHQSADYRPSGKDALEAALQVNQIDEYTKTRIRAVLALTPKIEASESSFPEHAKRSLDDLRNRLRSQSGEAKERLLRDRRLRSEVNDRGLIAGMEIAAEILKDGQDSIYSANHGFFNLLQQDSGSAGTTARDAVDNVKDADAIGATFGGFFGTFIVPGVGTVAGAVAGGASASAGAALSELWDWIWD